MMKEKNTIYAKKCVTKQYKKEQLQSSAIALHLIFSVLLLSVLLHRLSY